MPDDIRTVADLVDRLPPVEGVTADKPTPAIEPAKRKRNTVTVQKLRWEMGRAIELRAMLGADGEADPKLLLGTIEGETDLAEMCCLLFEETVDDEVLLSGLDAKLAELQARKSRIEKSVEERRTLILMAMDRAGIDTIKSPLATLSATPTKPKVVITDEALIPAAYFRPKDPVLDKVALKAALEALQAGQSIPGATLSNGGIGLTIRKK